MYNYYIQKLLDDVKEYYKENLGQEINPNELSFKELLKCFLEWNGIFGYTEYITTLCEYCLPIQEEDLYK